MKHEPTDDEVLRAIGGGSRITAVVCSYLMDNFKGIKTGYVRRRLMRLEAAGKVERRPTNYVTQICWGIKAPKD